MALTALQVAAVIQQAACCGPAPVHAVKFTVKGRRVAGNQNGLIHSVFLQKPSDHGVIMNEKDGHSTRIVLHLYSRKQQQQTNSRSGGQQPDLNCHNRASWPFSRPKPVHRL